MSRIWFPAGALALAGWLAGAAAAGDCYAIKDARIVVRPGYTIEKGTLVIRDGRIEAAGEVEAPFDAEVIDGHELVLYPGFIDAHTTLGIPANKPEEDKGAVPPPVVTEDPLPAMEDAYRKGVRPELSVDARFGLDEDGAKSWREAGFTAALSAPEDGYVAGQSALVSLSGSPRRAALLRPHVTMQAGFSGSGPGYPGTLMGALAYLRQLFLDARRYPEAWSFYRAHRASAARPTVDAQLEAMQPVMERTLPIVFRADGHLQMRLAIGLCEEFNLHGMIDGATEAHRMVNDLAAKKTPLIVRLDFPPEPKRDDKKDDKKAEKPAKGESKPDEKAEAKPDAKTETKAETKLEPAPAAPASTVAADTTTPAPATTPAPGAASAPKEEEPEPLFRDRKRRYDEAIKNAAVLNEHGVPFALTTAGADGPKKFFERLRVAVKAGLPEDAALRALTETPAQLFGAGDELGSLEPGKLAHVVAFDSGFLEDGAQVRYVFVDGRKFEMKAKPKKKDHAGDKDKGGGDATSVGGTWSVTVESPDGTIESTLTLEQSGTALTGTMKSEFGSSRVSGTIDGKSLSLTVSVDAGGHSFELKLSGTVEGDSMSGQVDSPFGEASKFKASKTPKAEER